MTAPTDALLPCPGCGDTRTRVIGGPGTRGGPKYWVGCDFCRWRTWGDTQDDAIAAWNRRATPAGSASGEDGLGARTDRLIRLAQANEKIEALQAEMARLRDRLDFYDMASNTAALDELRADAARWRYMRMRLTSDDGPSIEMAHAMLEGNADTLDREVDAAIQGSANGQG